MAYPQLTQEIMAQARAANDLAVIAQLRCDRWTAERLTEGGADVTFTEQCDAEVVIPGNLPETQRMALVVLAGRLALEGFEGRPQVVQNPDGGWEIFSLLD